MIEAEEGDKNERIVRFNKCGLLPSPHPGEFKLAQGWIEEKSQPRLPLEELSQQAFNIKDVIHIKYM